MRPYPNFLFILSLLFIILTNAQKSSSRKSESDVENNIANLLSILPSKLEKKDCWLLSKYFAHKTLDPVKSELEVAKYGGGYYNNFNCGTTMKYWKSKIAPKNLVVLLADGLRFIKQKHLLEAGRQNKELNNDNAFGRSRSVNENEGIAIAEPIQIDQNVPKFEKADIDDRVAKYDPERLIEISTEKIEAEEAERIGIWTILLFVLIGVIAICILIATCIAFCRSRRNDLDDEPSEESLPDYVGSGLSGASGEGKIIIMGSNSTIQESGGKHSGSGKRSTTNVGDINRNNRHNVVIDIRTVNTEDHDRMNQNF